MPPKPAQQLVAGVARHTIDADVDHYSSRDIKTPEPLGGSRGLARNLARSSGFTLWCGAQPDSLRTLTGRATGASTQRIQTDLQRTFHGPYDKRRVSSCQALFTRLDSTPGRCIIDAKLLVYHTSYSILLRRAAPTSSARCAAQAETTGEDNLWASRRIRGLQVGRHRAGFSYRPRAGRMHIAMLWGC